MGTEADKTQITHTHRRHFRSCPKGLRTRSSRTLPEVQAERPGEWSPKAQHRNNDESTRDSKGPQMPLERVS
jgi:hypothetical protein